MIAGFDRYFQIAPCFRDEDARADRSPGEFYQLDIEMSFVTQDDVFAAVEPVMRGVFEEFGGGKPVTQKFPLIPYADGDAQIRHRQAGPAQPDRDAGRHRRFSAAPASRCSRAFSRRCRRSAVWAIPAPGGGTRAFCDRMNSWAQGEGPAGPRLHLLRAEDGEVGGAARSPRTSGRSAPKQLRAQLGLKAGDAVFFVAGEPEKFVKFAGPARTKVGEELEPDREGPLRVLLDRRLPDVRMERGREEDRLLAQPVLDAEHGAGRVPGARSERQGQAARPQGDPVRHRLQRHRAVLRRDPQPSPRRDEEGVRASPAIRRTCWSRSSAACCARSRSARRRTAASRPASTAS